MGPQRRSRILLVAAVGAVALGSGACGGAATLGGRDGGNAGHGGAGGRDGGGAGHGGGGGTGHGGDGGAGHGDAGGVGQAGGASPDGGAGRDGGGDAAQCPPPDAQVAEPPPRGVALDGGVPIDQVAYAMAVARCNYQSRCFGLATYVADQCVDAIVNQGRWGYPVCASGGSDCESEIAAFAFPSAALLRAVGAGVIHYSPEREGECIAALLTQGCASPELKENIHACSGVFTCPAGGPGTGDGGATDGAVADGGASDAGATCAQLTSLGNLEFWTCATDDDCVGAPAPQGPDCVQGLCAASRCGITFDGCTSYAAAGQACASNAESLVDPGAVPQQMCAPGLNCQGALRPGYGTCVVPVGVGGPCTDNASCEIGLACACGACEIPPSSGPCVNGLCEVGVAYCDLASNSCRPVLQEGASCPAPHSCAAGLFCDDGVCKAS